MAKNTNQITSFHKEEFREKGAGMVEYAMLVALVGVALIASLKSLYVGVEDVFVKTSDKLASGGNG